MRTKELTVETREPSEQAVSRKKDAVFTISSDTTDSDGEECQPKQSVCFLLIFYGIHEASEWSGKAAVQEWGYSKIYVAQGWCGQVLVRYDREQEQNPVDKWDNICPEVYALDEGEFRNQMNAARKDSATWTCSDMAA